MRKRKKSGRGLLVNSYAEGIKRKVLEQNPEVFERVVRRRSGLYTLMKGHSLYYVGLSVKLKSRLNRHLDDRHRGEWDTFSFYSIGKKKYLKDIESVLVRVARPSGNIQKGKFGKNKNLKKRLIKELHHEILDSLGE
jgi:hypothetical protein